MTELAVQEPIGISPAQFDDQLEAAALKARSLTRIVEAQNLAVQIGPSTHLKVEAWLTIAAGYGYSAKVEWSRPLDRGGFEARALLVDGFGTEIAAGEAECGTDGDGQWVTSPAFQQRSMAQTRATVKACRAKLAWVVVLAGYSPTPSDEMTGAERPSGQSRARAAAAAKPLSKYGTCPEHKVPYFQSPNMRSPAHKTADGRWCNQTTVAGLWAEDGNAIVAKPRGPVGDPDEALAEEEPPEGA